jgi:GGDEF domain-containing protein
MLSAGYIHAHLRERLTTVAEQQMAFRILCIQVDATERFGAAYGAVAATAALHSVAQTVGSSLGATDFAGHSGGIVSWLC